STYIEQGDVERATAHVEDQNATVGGRLMGKPGDPGGDGLVDQRRQDLGQVGPLGRAEQPPSLLTVPHGRTAQAHQSASADVLATTGATATGLAQQLDDQVIDSDVAKPVRCVELDEVTTVADTSLDRADQLPVVQIHRLLPGHGRPVVGETDQ